MKVLILSPVPSHPPTSGNAARILGLGEELRRQGHEVWFLHSDFQQGDPEAMQRHWGDRYMHHSYQRPWKKHRLTIGAIPVPDRWHGWFVRNGLAYQTVDHFYDPSLDGTLRSLQKKQKFDVVCAEYVFFSKALDAFPATVRKLLDTHDVYANRHHLFRANSRSPEWFYTTPGEERRGLMRADCILAIQEREGIFFEKLLEGRRDVTTVGHFVEPRPMPFSGEVKNILFLGSANTLNVQAIRGFLSNVWPDLRKQVPQARMLIGGNVCDSLPEAEGITLLGPVKALETAYMRADVVINPITFGTGLKIKGIEALAYGRPLVTTSCGAEGLEHGAGTAFILADTAEEFRKALVDLFQHPGKAETLSRAAVEFVRDYGMTQAGNLARAIHGELFKSGGVNDER